MNEINNNVIEVPRPFRLACELLGISVPDFLQLFVEHYSFIANFFNDKSSYDIVTKSFSYVMKDKEHSILSSPSTLDSNQIVELQNLVKRMVKIALNRNYSYSQRRNKGKVLASKMFDVLVKSNEVKTVIYMDEETKINLNKEILVNGIISNTSVVEFLNRIMLYVSLPEHLARMHLNKGVYNPVLAFYMRVYDGYGDLIDLKYRDSVWFKEFMMEIQEWDKRYFFTRDIDQRINTYQESLDNYLLNNRY